MTLKPKTITMMSIPVRFHPNVFVGGFRVDQYQIWKNKETKKRFAGLTLTYETFGFPPGEKIYHMSMSDQQIFS